ncbi:nuclear transport factor 2 family protein [Nocardioides ferulae]|uniref:nuclear transport factor 2 family protein n=1 Tax=Nocardioides ferulae TaxID=2340821 RepID=UPI001F0C1BE5|nr:nuclear transport factor 2 family protein [Nocardioides ferulae]
MQTDSNASVTIPAPILARLEITDVLTRYTRAIDTGEWDLLDQVFTPDAEIDYTETGGIADRFEVVKAWLGENLPIFPQRQHLLGQVSVELSETGEEAQVAAYFYNPMVLPTGDGRGMVVEFGGIYHHAMVRTPAGWRSRRLHEQLVWKRGL